MLEYQVLRSKRKTLSLQVKQGQVFVRAPFHVDEEFISSFIHKKDAWLRAKITQQAQTLDYCCDFTQGSKLFVFGQLATLNIIYAKTGRRSETYLSDLDNSQQELNIVIAKRTQDRLDTESQLASEVKKQIEGYFKAQAPKILLPKVEYYAQLTNLSPTSVKIRQYRARWGSCNNKGELSFNYLLMMLPIYVIEYVIVHELCHLSYLNHSKQFWLLVAKYFPNYVDAKKWIKVNQSALYWRAPL